MGNKKDRKVHWVSKSADAKVGPVMVSYSPLETCPDSCGFKSGGCYAWELFYLRILGEKIGDGRLKVRTLKEAMGKRKPEGRIARHRVAGDIVGDVPETIAEIKMIEAAGLTNIGYTHHWRAEEAQPLKEYFRASCNTVEEAEEAISMGWAVTVAVHGESVPKSLPLAGQKAFLCPARKGVEGKKDINCDSCRLCRVDERTKNKIVMFETHGTKGGIERAKESSIDLDLMEGLK